MGAIGFPGIGFTRASWIAYTKRKGVMIPIVSPGSNHVGASETCTAHVIWPSGEAGAAVGTNSVRSRVRSNATARGSALREIERSGVRPVMGCLLCVVERSGAKPRGTTNGIRSDAEGIRESAGCQCRRRCLPPDVLFQLLDTFGDDPHELI